MMRLQLLKHALILYAAMVICLKQGSAIAIGFGESDGENPPTEIYLRDAKPLSAAASYFVKFDQFKQAIDDNDFHRVIALFSECANVGDPMCQFFLADGVSEWLLRDTVPHEKEYGSAFVREWLRRAVRREPLGCVRSKICLDPYGFVTMNWSAYYFIGAFGFPKDKALSRCWREVWNSNNDMSPRAVLARVETCRELEFAKYGEQAEWLSQ